MKMSQADINALAKDNFYLFDFRNSMEIVFLASSPSTPENYSTRQYDLSLMNEVLDFLKTKVDQVKLNYVGEYRRSELAIDQAIKEIKAHKVLSIEFNRDRIEGLKREFLHTCLGKEMNIESFFWNYNLTTACRHFRKVGLMALRREDKLVVDMFHKAGNLSTLKIADFNINLLMKHHDALFSEIGDLDASWQTYQQNLQKVYRNLNAVKGESDKIHKKEFLLRTVIGALIYKQDLNCLDACFERNHDVVREPSVAKFFSGLDQNVFKEILEQYEHHVEQSLQLNQTEVQVQQDPVEQRTYQIDMAEIVKKYQVAFNDAKSLTLQAVRFIKETLKMKTYSFEEQNNFEVICYGEERQLNLVKSFLYEVINNETFIKDTEQRPVNFGKMMGYLELNMQLPTPQTARLKAKI